MGQNSDFATAPDFGYCASQGIYFFGYKLHALCGLSGVIHSYDLSKASVHDINYLKDIKPLYHDCSIFGDRGYIEAVINLICLKLQISSWNVLIGLIRKIGNRHLLRSQRPEKELKHCSRN